MVIFPNSVGQESKPQESVYELTKNIRNAPAAKSFFSFTRYVRIPPS